MRETIRLGDLCTIVSGTTPKTGNDEYWDGDIMWVTPAELTEESFIINDTVRKITDKAVKESGLKSFPEGTVLLSSRAPIGKVAIAGKEMYCNQGFKNFICNDKLKNEYLYWFLKGKKEYLNSLGRGATFKEISKSIVENIQIPFPDVNKQIYISSVLNKCQSIIRFRKEQMKQLEYLIKSRFVEMFGRPELNEQNWEMYTFADICTVRQGLQIPISQRLTEEQENCYEYITVAYLNGGKQREYIQNPKSTVICNKEDLLMTRTGNTGMVITNVKGVFHNNFFIIDFDRKRFDKTFLFYYLKLEYIQADIIRRAGTSTIPDLNHGEFYKINVYEPPIDRQNQFAAFVQQVDKLKVEVLKSLDETQRLFNSLMQKYFD